MAEVIKGAVNLYGKMAESASQKQFAYQHQVAKNIYETSLSSSLEIKAQKAPMLTVKCNYARDRAIVINNGELILVFDRDGFARIPASSLSVLEIEMKHRPGRYQILGETVETPVIEATPEPVIEEDAKGEDESGEQTEESTEESTEVVEDKPAEAPKKNKSKVSKEK